MQNRNEKTASGRIAAVAGTLLGVVVLLGSLVVTVYGQPPAASEQAVAVFGVT